MYTSELWKVDALNVKNTGGQSYFDSAVPGRCAACSWILQDLENKAVVNHSKLPQPVASLLDRWANLAKSLMPGGGTWLWGMLLLGVGALHNKRWDVLVILAPALATWETLLLGTPYALAFRYVAFAPIITLFAFSAIFSNKWQETRIRVGHDFS